MLFGYVQLAIKRRKEMKIFSDMHHQGLYASFHYLFENRLGFELYRPIGMEWFEKGYWKIAEPYNNAIGTVKQFLETGYIPQDSTPPLNQLNQKIIRWAASGSSFFSAIHDLQHGFDQKAVTFREFLDLNVDIIIASIPAHVHAYKKLIRDYSLKAKLIYQIGNIGWHNEVPWLDVDNIMASVKKFPIKHAGKNVVFYRQEFDLNVFKPHHPLLQERLDKSIRSFVNCLPQPEKFDRLKELLPDFTFRAFGASCPDGVVDTISTMATLMRNSYFGLHNKPHGDGYGHVIHNWMACGKPVIVNLKDYEDKLAGELLEDEVTCIDMSRRSLEEVAEKVREYAQPEKYTQMSTNVIQRFKEVVDFEKDAENVENFLLNLK